MPKPQRVQLTSTAPDAKLDVALGEGFCTVTGGYGGWQTIARPQRIGVRVWTGFEPITMTVPLLFDHWGEGSGSGLKTQSEMAILEQMAGRGEGGGNLHEPPIVKLDAEGGVVPHTNLNWTIDGIEWGEGIVNDSGNWERRYAVVTFVQKIENPNLSQRSNAGVNTGGSRNVTVKKGDTLHSLAKKYLGDEKRWTEIATLNGIHDTRTLTKRVGKTIKIPPKGK